MPRRPRRSAACGSSSRKAFRELARLKMDALKQEQVVGQLDAAERQALNLLNSRREALRQLTERRRQAEERVRQAEAAQQTAVDALEKILEQVETIRRNVEAKVSIDAEWITARAEVNQVTGQAQQAEKKAVQAEADRDEKRRPYEEDQLFMYLWNRKFGTAEYRADHFTRTMDRLVARVVGYDKARANYALLNEIPERLREHSRRILHQLREEREKLTALERKALVEAGIEAAEAEAAKARDALANAEHGLAEAQESLATLDRTYDASVLEGDAPYREAVELLAAADKREDLNQLYQEALRTPTPRDEEIVRRIQATDVMMNRALHRLWTPTASSRRWPSAARGSSTSGRNSGTRATTPLMAPSATRPPWATCCAACSPARSAARSWARSCAAAFIMDRAHGIPALAAACPSPPPTGSAPVGPSAVANSGPAGRSDRNRPRGFEDPPRGAGPRSYRGEVEHHVGKLAVRGACPKPARPSSACRALGRIDAPGNQP